MIEFVNGPKDAGNAKEASAKPTRSRLSKADSSDSGSTVSDVGSSLFSVSNVKEIMKQLKEATEPLHQLLAEAEEQLAKDSQLDDISTPEQKSETLVAKLKTQYFKSLDALSAVKQRNLDAGVKNSTDGTSLPIVSVDRLHEPEHTSVSVTGVDSVAGDDSESVQTDAVSSSRTANSMNTSSRASRADIEAQRDLHKQMLTSKDNSSEESGDSSNSESSSTSSSDDDEDEESSSDEYDPKKEIQQVKLERGHERRTTMKKQKMRAGK